MDILFENYGFFITKKRVESRLSRRTTFGNIFSLKYPYSLILKLKNSTRSSRQVTHSLHSQNLSGVVLHHGQRSNSGLKNYDRLKWGVYKYILLKLFFLVHKQLIHTICFYLSVKLFHILALLCIFIVQFNRCLARVVF